MTEAPLPFFARLWLALVVAFRILASGVFARRVKDLDAPPRLPEPAPAAPAAPPAPVAPATAHTEDALMLLSLLQREGRLVDFLKQEIESFSDADVGAAARVVHGGCRRALLSHFEVAPVRTEPEGSAVVLEAGFDGAATKLTGDVRGAPPYRGVVRHAGWRVVSARLPERVPGSDARLLAPAEVEL